MAIVFTILIVAVSVLLVLAVLVQRSKGGGLASNLGISNQFLGAKKETDTIEKTTWTLVGILVVLCLGSGFAFKGTTTTTAPGTEIETPTLDPGLSQSPTAPSLPQGPAMPK